MLFMDLDGLQTELVANGGNDMNRFEVVVGVADFYISVLVRPSMDLDGVLGAVEFINCYDANTPCHRFIYLSFCQSEFLF